MNPSIPLWFFILILHVGVAALLWALFGRDHTGRGSIIPNEEPLHDLTPYEAGALLAQGATYASFLGLILDLERRGIIHLLRQESSGYVFYCVERKNRSLPMDELERAVLHRLMRYPFSQPNDEEMERVELSLRSMECRLAFRLFQSRIQKHFVQRGWFSFNLLHFFTVSGIVLLAWTYFVFTRLEQAFPSVQNQWIFLIIPLVAPFVFHMPRLSKQGAIARERVLGLARYIEVAEKDRLAFHEAPRNAKEEKDRLLPYAVALDIDPSWRRFAKNGYTSL